MMEQSVDERPPSAERDHPPFRMRERRLMLLPDLHPPSIEEIRWAARERRRRRDASAPEQRRPVSHDRLELREPADVPASVVEDTQPETELRTIELPPEAVLPVEAAPEEAAAAPVAVEAAPEEIAAAPAEAEAPVSDLEARFPEPELDPDFLDLRDPEFPDLRPWQPLVLPDPDPVDRAEPSWVSDVRTDLPPVVVEPEPAPPVEPEPIVEPRLDEPRDDDDAPPLVSHVLVVREPAPEAGRIAVLDEVETDALTVTRLLPLSPEPVEHAVVEPTDGPVVETLAYEDTRVEELEELEPELEVPTEVDGRAAPLYWRLLRLRYTRPNGWLRALYFEGSVALGVVLVLAEVASVWTIVVLPVIVAVVVKANDVLAGNLRTAYRQPKRRG
ncbi:MAG TPA: hypothetical protein VHA79_11225 [Mycobacteriales bacterium]|nr:hypothetical protein [Mycobacteriales bacterium]